MHSTTHRKIGAAGATCTPTRHRGAAVFETARSTVPRTAAKIGRGDRGCTGTDPRVQRGLSPLCLLFQPRRENGADGGNCTLTGLRPPASRAGAYAVSPRPHKMDPARRVALRSSQYHWDTSLPTLCRNKIGRGGRTCTSAARWGDAFTARCNCCSATPRKWGLGRDSHPRPSPYEGAALTTAPPSHGGPPR